MAFVGGGSGGKATIIGMKETRAHLSNLQDALKIEKGRRNEAWNALNTVLRIGTATLREAYEKAEADGVENTSQVAFGWDIEDGWGRVHANRSNIYFAEFGSGINLNSGTPLGEKLGFTPASWSTGAEGKGFLIGNRLATFKGWWPVKSKVPNAEVRTFVTRDGKMFERSVVQGNAPVNGMEASAKEMKRMLAPTMAKNINKVIKKG